MKGFLRRLLPGKLAGSLFLLGILLLVVMYITTGFESHHWFSITAIGVGIVLVFCGIMQYQSESI